MPLSMQPIKSTPLETHTKQMDVLLFSTFKPEIENGGFK